MKITVGEIIIWSFAEFVGWLTHKEMNSLLILWRESKNQQKSQLGWRVIEWNKYFIPKQNMT